MKATPPKWLYSAVNGKTRNKKSKRLNEDHTLAVAG